MTDSDESLVIKSRDGERAAFEELVRRTARLVYARLLLDTGSPHHAEDLSQEVFLTAWRSIRQLEDPATFRGWLLSIAQSVWLDALRRGGRKKRKGIRRREEALGLLADPSPTPAEAAERHEAQQQLLAALRELPERYRQPLMLRYLAGADYSAIERQLALSNGALRGLLNRGMAMLRETIRTAEVKP